MVTTVISAAMRVTAVIYAGVSPLTMVMLAVVAFHVGVIPEIAGKKLPHRLVARTADTAEKLNARIGKSHLRTAADTAADKSSYILSSEKFRKCAVTATVCINDLG